VIKDPEEWEQDLKWNLWRSGCSRWGLYNLRLGSSSTRLYGLCMLRDLFGNMESWEMLERAVGKRAGTDVSTLSINSRADL
jgi:hypothetical protein